MPEKLTAMILTALLALSAPLMAGCGATGNPVDEIQGVVDAVDADKPDSEAAEDPSENQAPDADSSDVQASEGGGRLAGTVEEYKGFSIVVPQGWQSSGSGGSVVITPVGNAIIPDQVRVMVQQREFPEGHAQTEAEKWAKEYGGSEVKEAEFFGTTFWGTYYQEAGQDVYFWIGQPDGKSVTIITKTDLDTANLGMIDAIVDSVVLH